MVCVTIMQKETQPLSWELSQAINPLHLSHSCSSISIPLSHITLDEVISSFSPKIKLKLHHHHHFLKKVAHSELVTTCKQGIFFFFYKYKKHKGNTISYRMYFRWKRKQCVQVTSREEQGGGKSEMEVWHKKKARAGCLAGSHEKQPNVCSATRAWPLLSGIKVNMWAQLK